MAIKISHEVPLCLLEQSREFNDYDYALVHLFPKYKEYFKFYLKSVKMGRHVLLDNSIFELGRAYNAEEYREWVEHLKPTEYIVPDVFDDKEENLLSIRTWFEQYKPNTTSTPICVAHGSTFEELLEGFVEITRILDAFRVAGPWRVAIPFHSRAFGATLFDWLWGRPRFVDHLINMNIISRRTSIHLLGCSLPQEFRHYRGPRYSQISTLDTSNPIVLGIEGSVYGGEELTMKPRSKLVDHIVRTDFDVDIVMSNIKVFREKFV